MAVGRTRRGVAERRLDAARRRGQRADLAARVVTALPLIALAIVLVALGGWVFAAGVLVLAVMGLRELFSMYERAHPAVFPGILGLAGLVVAARLGDAGTVLLAFVASLPVVFLLGLGGPRRIGVPGLTVTVFGLAWIGVALAHAVLLRELPHGGGVLALVLVATFAGDTGAYLGGRLLGRRRLAPTISPGKTVEGLVIGMIAGALGGWATGLYQDWLPGWQALVIGAAVAVIAPLGDLFESFVKREAGTKDSGRVFGAHGGALDRLDAALFAVVVGYWVWRALL
ncbi:MAG: phosphatidate cytidylyltransferase [Solirubrobacteraceae bacterium]|nr:phosphatidate cytidylyltransferase [Solirubrobacteraceae bacterium]